MLLDLPANPTRSLRARRVRIVEYVAGAGVAVSALVLVLPSVSGAPWAAVVTTLAAIPVSALAALSLLWLAGLLANTLTLTAALPGLSHRRALLLSLTGSAVANVLPLGGAAGVALNYRMTKGWGFTPSGFASYTVVTNLWDILAKLTLPLLVLPLLVHGLPVGTGLLGTGLLRAITVAAVSLPALALLAAALLAAPGVAVRFGRRVEAARAAAALVVVTAWRRLSLGVALYTALLFALLLACLRVTDAGVPWQVVLVAFCVERLATLVGLTPGGLGVVEVGLVGALMLAPGASAPGVAAAVVVYRSLTFGLEIPVGGLLLAGWFWRRRTPS